MSDGPEASNLSLRGRTESVTESEIAAASLRGTEDEDEMLSLATLSSYIEEACKATARGVLDGTEESVGVGLSVRQLCCVRPGDRIRLRTRCVREPTSLMIHLHVAVDLGTQLALIADHSRLIVERGTLRDRQQARRELAI